MQQQLQQLKNQSLQIVRGMLAYWTNTDRVQELDPHKYLGRLNNKKVFAIAGKNARKKVIGFAHKGEMYITPYTKEKVQILRNAGYAEYAFFVPLSPEEMSLVDESLATKWQRLVTDAKSSRQAVSATAASL